jgi:hypothetical protein
MKGMGIEYRRKEGLRYEDTGVEEQRSGNCFNKKEKDEGEKC